MSAQIDPWNIDLPVIHLLSAEIAENLPEHETKPASKTGQAFETTLTMLDTSPN